MVATVNKIAGKEQDAGCGCVCASLRRAGAGAAGVSSSLPDGNHGDNLQTTEAFALRMATEEVIASGLDLALSYGMEAVQSKAFVRAVNRFIMARMKA